MQIFGSKKSRATTPLLNLIWFILFLPVVVILYLLWQERLPWLQEEPASSDRPKPRRQSQPNRTGKVSSLKVRDTSTQAPQPQTERRPERRPDEKQQKDMAKNERRPERQEELEIIEGIGPKTASILREAGIRTFRQLSETSVDQLNSLLREAGLRMNPPDTWPEQARLAANEDWEGLEQYKRQLHAGRETKE